MKQDDRLEEFFRSKLSSTEPAADGWNVPEEHLWQAAKKDFPKKNNRKIFGFWMLSILTFAALSTFVWSLTSSDPTLKLDREIIELASSRDDRIPIETKTNYQPNNEEGQDDDVDKSGTHRDAAITFPIVQTPKEPTIEPTPSMASASPAQLRTTPLFNNRHLEGATLGNAVVPDMSKSTASLTQQESNHTSAMKAVPIFRSAQIRDLPTIEPAPPASIFLLNPKAPALASGLTIVQKDRHLAYIKKWELGLSLAPLAFGIDALFAEDGNDAPLSEKVDHSYLNLNTHISRRLHPKWSFSTGLSYTRLQIDYRFSDIEIYKNSFSRRSIESIVGDESVVGSIAANGDQNNVTIIYKEDVDLTSGDELLVRGLVPLDFNVLQIPLIINFHLAKNRWEWLFQGGATLDYVHWDVDNIDIGLFKENRLVTEPAQFTPIRGSTIGVSPYLGVGIRHHISQRVNIGINSRIGPADLGFDIGCYFRFNK